MWGADSSNKKAGEKMINKQERRATVAAVTRQMSTIRRDETIISEFVHGSKLAAGAFVVMFIFLSMGVVIFGW